MNVLETVPSQNSVTPHNAFLQSRNRDSSSFILDTVERIFFFVSLAIPVGTAFQNYAFCNLFDCTKNGYSLQNSIGERIRPPAMLIIFGYLTSASL